jgi:hypothetical protein
MIKRHESCWGLSFPAIGKWKVEFWFCPPNYEIRKHKHPNVNIQLFFLFGHNVEFYRERSGPNEPIIARRTVKCWHTFSRFNILRGDYHSFSVSRFPLVFMNVEEWFAEPTSAADDFQYE